MSIKTLWMGDVQPDWDDNFIHTIFINAKGLLTIKIMRDKNQSYNSYGFLDFTTHEEAEDALEGYNGRTIPGTGYVIRLNWGGTGKSESLDEYCLFVENLGTSINAKDLETLMKPLYPSFIDAKTNTDPETKKPKGTGFVRFKEREDAEKALLEQNGKRIGHRDIKLSFISLRQYEETKRKNREKKPLPEIPTVGPNGTFPPVNYMPGYPSIYGNNTSSQYPASGTTAYSSSVQSHSTKRTNTGNIYLMENIKQKENVPLKNEQYISKSIRIFDVDSISMIPHNQ
ncbi:hypothetical protein WA158_000244 [Blastocystis sp. Blastoise]